MLLHTKEEEFKRLRHGVQEQLLPVLLAWVASVRVESGALELSISGSLVVLITNT